MTDHGIGDRSCWFIPGGWGSHRPVAGTLFYDESSGGIWVVGTRDGQLHRPGGTLGEPGTRPQWAYRTYEDARAAAIKTIKANLEYLPESRHRFLADIERQLTRYQLLLAELETETGP